VLGLFAAAVGAAVSAQLPRLLFVLVADSATRVQFPFPVTPDASVLTYVLVIGVASALVCSLAPALMITRVAMRRAVGRDVDVISHRIRLRSVFLAVQMAVSVILLASAGLLARRAQRGAASFDPGFRVDGVTAVSFAVPERTYDRARATTLFETISQTMRQRRDADYAFASRDPFSLYREGTLIRLPGESTDSLHEVLYLDVSPNYLSLLEIPLRAGRGFRESDTGQPSVVVNEAMAQAFWPGRDPVGQSFVMRRRGPAGEMVVQQVIGVARNVSVSASANARPTFYRAITPGTEVLEFLSQDPRASQAPVLLVKGPASVAAQAAATATSRDPRIRTTLTPLADSFARVQASMKWGPLLAATLGMFALALTTVGMFGVFAYAVQQRTREIGVRIALGAQPAAVVRLIVTGHSRAIAIGVAIGILGAMGSSVGLRGRLFGLSPIDPLTYGGVALLLACCSLAATYIPVRRATQISPTIALRSE
jgi:putative ABC transport system permease protein